jgi:hypothetical protein
MTTFKCLVGANRSNEATLLQSLAPNHCLLTIIEFELLYQPLDRIFSDETIAINAAK